MLNENNPDLIPVQDTALLKPVVNVDSAKAVAVVSTDVIPEQTSTFVKKSLIHTVLAKEGLYSISKKYNVTIQQLKEWNNLQSDALRTGQQLFVQTN